MRRSLEDVIKMLRQARDNPPSRMDVQSELAQLQLARYAGRKVSPRDRALLRQAIRTKLQQAARARLEVR